MSPPTRKLAAVMAADVAGYSKLMGEDETGTLGALRDFRKSLFEPSIAEHRGTVIKSMGDGWLVEFDSVVDAVNCATRIQEALDANAVLKLRIGIHIGDIVHEEDDIFGDGVNVAARLQQIALPGGIVLSDFAHRSIDATLGARFSNLGAKTLKNIRTPITAFGWRSDGGLVVPAPDNTPDGPKSGRPLDKDLKISGVITLVMAPGVAVMGLVIGQQEQAAFIPLLGAAVMVGFVGGGLLLASSIIRRWQ
jgi:class 3 adenylate cyclase